MLVIGIFYILFAGTGLFILKLLLQKELRIIERKNTKNTIKRNKLEKSLFINDRTLKILQRLYQEKDLGRECLKFKNEKIRKCLLIILISGLMSIPIEIAQINESPLQSDDSLIRNEVGQGPKNVTLNLVRGDINSSQKIDIVVNERKYTDKELNTLYEDFSEKFEKKVLGDNKSFDYINTPLNLCDKYEGYPFSIRWTSDKPLILSAKGLIDNKKLKDRQDALDGILVKLTANITYEDFSENKELYVRVYPLLEKKTFSELFNEELEKMDKNSSSLKKLYLPRAAGDIPIYYREVKEKKSAAVLLMGIMIAAYICVHMDQKVKDDEIKRNEEMLRDYPKLLNKYTLYYLAGMSSKKIWDKICNDYSKDIENGGKAHYVYEEMLSARRGMNDGIGEIVCYEAFATRCNLNKYRTFINLVEQAIQTGRADMSIVLEKEVVDSFNERKNQAKILGEKAGTKLLLPMFMMLSIVIIMIILPAFLTFSM